MRKLLTTGLIALHACALPGLALAQSATVWRCGADGRSFSDTPCAQGQVSNYAVSRPAADLDAAQARAQREQQLADRLTSERLQREAASRGNGLAGMPLPTAAVRPAAVVVAKHKKARPQPHALQPEAGGTWRAAVPATPRKKG